MVIPRSSRIGPLASDSLAPYMAPTLSHKRDVVSASSAPPALSLPSARTALSALLPASPDTHVTAVAAVGSWSADASAGSSDGLWTAVEDVSLAGAASRPSPPELAAGLAAPSTLRSEGGGGDAAEGV